MGGAGGFVTGMGGNGGVRAGGLSRGWGGGGCLEVGGGCLGGVFLLAVVLVCLEFVEVLRRTLFAHCKQAPIVRQRAPVARKRALQL